MAEAIEVVHSYRDLRIWKTGMALTKKIYLVSRELPKSENYELATQMRRAAVSIPSNIAEGHARIHTREYLNHVSIAQGSLAELRTQLELSVQLGYLTARRLNEITDLCEELSKQMYALRKALFKRLSTPDFRSLTPAH